MLILASQSPRRQEILKSAGIEFRVRLPAGVEEKRMPGENADVYVTRLARAKAASVRPEPGDIVLGADTVVVVDDQILEKPRDAADAARMLRLLSGREHFVVTGVCLRSQWRSVIASESTRVRFVPLTEPEIAAYVESGEPMDKAGAYAIQGLASKFIDRIDGCYWNVVGLPAALVYRQLKQI